MEQIIFLNCHLQFLSFYVVGVLKVGYNYIRAYLPSTFCLFLHTPVLITSPIPVYEKRISLLIYRLILLRCSCNTLTFHGGRLYYPEGDFSYLLLWWKEFGCKMASNSGEPSSGWGNRRHWSCPWVGNLEALGTWWAGWLRMGSLRALLFTHPFWKEPWASPV